MKLGTGLAQDILLRMAKAELVGLWIMEMANFLVPICIVSTLFERKKYVQD